MIRIAPGAAALALLLLSTPTDAQRSSRRVFAASDIAAAGWHRLGDVVAALPPGSVASIDGFNAQLTSTRVPFAEFRATTIASWSVRLDGQRIPVAVDGNWILDALPVAMAQIDSVVIITGPRIVDGHAVLLGTLDFYTRRPPIGFSLVGDYQHGDETGDPGPYRYTARSNPNVEKIGPVSSGVAAFARRRWSLEGAARYTSLNVTDTNILNRFPGLFGQYQTDVNASGGSGVLTTSFGGAIQQTLAGRGRFTGLLWIPSLRREESARVIVGHAGSSGGFIKGGTTVRYGATATSLDVAELRTPLVFSVGQTRNTVDAFVAVSPRRRPVSMGAGITSMGLDRGSSGYRTAAEPRAWVSYDTDIAATTAAIKQSQGGTSLSWSGMVERRLSGARIVTVSVAALRTSGEADHAWFDRYGAVSAERPVGLIDLRAEITADRNRGLIPTLYTRAWRISGLRQRLPDLEDADVGLAGGFRFSTAPGSRVSAFLGGELSRLRPSDEFGAGSTPSSFLEGSVSTVVAGNFRLAAIGRYASQTSWLGLQAGARTTLAPLRRVDVSVNKPLWHERIQAQVIVRNLLAAEEVYHPLGAQWNLRTHLGVTVALPPYGRRRGGPR